ncbi:MAG: hypothetical protein ACHREM_04550 [Polyangiales bacterium]
MNKLFALAAAVAAFTTVATVAPTAGATNYSLWIHGRTGGTPTGWSYWKNGGGNYIEAGVNAVAVNYNGSAHISASNPTVVAALNTYCKGNNSCYVQAHSAGAAQIGYAEALYPRAWNIIWVLTGGSAAGGSELAGNTAYFFTGYAIDLDLPVGTMRSMYNHDVLGDDITGYVYNYVGGDYSSLTTCLFPGGCLFGSGGNDTAVAFHSAGHYRNSGTYGNDPSTGTAGGNWWDYSYALWVDSTNGTTGHCVAQSYPCYEGTAGGIMGVVAGTAAGYDK